MKLRITLVLKVVIAVVVITFAFGFFFLYGPWVNFLTFVISQKAERSRVQLLCKTDHQDLLKACRELSIQVAAGDLSPGHYGIRDGRRSLEISSFPKQILKLRPNHVYINKDGRVVLTFAYGRLGRFGVQAYPKDYKNYKESVIKLEYGGHRELIHGLWYYDNGYVDNPEYDKKIEALLQKRK